MVCQASFLQTNCVQSAFLPGIELICAVCFSFLPCYLLVVSYVKIPFQFSLKLNPLQRALHNSLVSNALLHLKV